MQDKHANLLRNNLDENGLSIALPLKTQDEIADHIDWLRAELGWSLDHQSPDYPCCAAWIACRTHDIDCRFLMAGERLQNTGVRP